MMLNFDPKRPVLRCTHCKRERSEHQAVTLACPQGRKHRVHGFGWFSAATAWQPRKVAP